jgi:hypothetical protein
VKYQYPEIAVQSEAKSIEAKLVSLETNVKDRLDRLEAAFNGRLDAMESLLRAVIAGQEPQG